MSSFESRWRALTRAARTAEPPLPEAPLHRVRGWLEAGAAARRRELAAGAGSGELWFRYGTRGLATATLVLLASVWFAFSGSAREREPQSLRPGIENAVSDVFWLL